MSSNSYKELKRNTYIIAFSNLGSKIISFVLAPLYSFYLSTEQYGTMDLILTTSSVLLPILCFDIYEGTFRYACDDEYEGKVVLSSSIFICVVEMLVCIMGMIIGVCLFHIPNYVLACVFSTVLDSFYQVLSQYARGKKKINVFAFSGLVNSFVILASNLVLLVILKMELRGWLISFLSAKILSLIYISVKMRIWKEYHIKAVDCLVLRDMLKYSIPLVPTASFWWIMNLSDRYVITMFVGLGATGVYSVANKLPVILSMFESVFYQAWQTTAINTMKDENRDEFYSQIFMNYFRILVLGILGLLVILKPLIVTLFASDYLAAWECASILVVGVAIHALAGNLGTLYAVFKEPKRALVTALIGAITNILLNIIFIPYYGINAAAYTTLIAYFIVLLVRWNDSKRYIKLELPIPEVVRNVILVFIQLYLYYLKGGIALLMRLLLFAIFLVINRKLIMKIIKIEK